MRAYYLHRTYSYSRKNEEWYKPKKKNATIQMQVHILALQIGSGALGDCAREIPVESRAKFRMNRRR